mmetsp:Transcript_29801/g.67516  ORF Transcript_29801/g.67516 Transcript_29801/m.67516 type:complete len:194 (-) Transcript_29801:355-936(-)|eukprot:CAMPEP_0197891304 /NCGR_PEP_ID=MMETSP1439-20131203/28015_1 /TAXON_ID=66791 /ORGANISM="Gonyaulax spinifera, Strain CCMP409" /LENGTH=193 /DNA_ID=CAMNT_0043511397 /DNA_START=67 /DNA_END=648 /DNA_ORIENTATION=+
MMQAAAAALLYFFVIGTQATRRRRLNLLQANLHEPGAAAYCQALRDEIRRYDGPGVSAQRGETRYHHELHGVLKDTTVTVARFSEDTRWADELRELGANVTVRQTEGNSEVASFIRGLVDSYDSERKVSVCLHGGSPADWHSPTDILDIIESIDAEKLLGLGGYASLNLEERRDEGGGLGAQSALFSYRMDCL